MSYWLLILFLNETKTQGEHKRYKLQYAGPTHFTPP